MKARGKFFSLAVDMGVDREEKTDGVTDRNRGKMFW
jgi:hypothetical protein